MVFAMHRSECCCQSLVKHIKVKYVQHEGPQCSPCPLLAELFSHLRALLYHSYYRSPLPILGRNMKATLLLIVTVLITSVSAFGDAGIYERLWYWYAYTLDTSGSKIGPGCSKGPSRCTFVQFMTYIDQQTYEGVPETQSGVDPKEIAKTDPNDLKKAVRTAPLARVVNADRALKFDQLKNGHYSGPYWADKIHSDFSSTTRDDVSKLFLSIAGFVEGKIHDADPKMKQNLKDVRGDALFGSNMPYTSSVNTDVCTVGNDGHREGTYSGVGQRDDKGSC